MRGTVRSIWRYRFQWLVKDKTGALAREHRQEPRPKIWNKYSQERNCAATVPNPNFHIHVSVRDLAVPLSVRDLYPTIDLPILLQELCGPILEIYKTLTDTWMGLRPRNSQKGIHKWDFPSVRINSSNKQGASITYYIKKKRKTNSKGWSQC